MSSLPPRLFIGGPRDGMWLSSPHSEDRPISIVGQVNHSFKFGFSPHETPEPPSYKLIHYLPRQLTDGVVVYAISDMTREELVEALVTGYRPSPSPGTVPGA